VLRKTARRADRRLCPALRRRPVRAAGGRGKRDLAGIDASAAAASTRR